MYIIMDAIKSNSKIFAIIVMITISVDIQVVYSYKKTKKHIRCSIWFPPQEIEEYSKCIQYSVPGSISAIWPPEKKIDSCHLMPRMSLAKYCSTLPAHCRPQIQGILFENVIFCSDSSKTYRSCRKKAVLLQWLASTSEM